MQRGRQKVSNIRAYPDFGESRVIIRCRARSLVLAAQTIAKAVIDRPLAWSRPAGEEHGSVLRHQPRKFPGVVRHRAERSDRSGDRAQIRGLMQASPILVQRRAVIGAGYHQHRDRVGVGLADAGGRFGDARSRYQAANTGLSGDAVVAAGPELLLDRDAGAGRPVCHLVGNAAEKQSL